LLTCPASGIEFPSKCSIQLCFAHNPRVDSGCLIIANSGQTELTLDELALSTGQARKVVKAKIEMGRTVVDSYLALDHRIIELATDPWPACANCGIANEHGMFCLRRDTCQRRASAVRTFITSLPWSERNVPLTKPILWQLLREPKYAKHLAIVAGSRADLDAIVATHPKPWSLDKLDLISGVKI
jgi:hypothetical protein